MNEKKYQVEIIFPCTTPANSDSNSQEIKRPRFDTEKEAVDYAELHKDNCEKVEVRNTVTNEVIITFQDGKLIDGSDSMT